MWKIFIIIFMIISLENGLFSDNLGIQIKSNNEEYRKAAW